MMELDMKDAIIVTHEEEGEAPLFRSPITPMPRRGHNET
jgi:hypothetical protein